MELGIRDLLGEQNQGPEEIGRKRAELQSLSSAKMLAQDALAQGSISGHVLVPAQGFVARLRSRLCLYDGTGWWQRALAAPVGLDLVGSSVWGRMVLSRAQRRGFSAETGRSWKIAATAAVFKLKHSKKPWREMQTWREMQIAWSSLCNKNLCPLYNWGKANKETCLQVGTWCHWEKSHSKSETSDSLSGLLTLWQKGNAFIVKFSD